MNIRLATVIFTSLLLFCLTLFMAIENVPKGMSSYVYGAIGIPDIEEPKETILFSGDIMLGRRVETLMNYVSKDYPFHRISSFLKTHTYVVSNFEAPIPKKHKQTPDLNMQFSVPSTSVEVLYKAGINVGTLANNHTLDKGKDNYEHTRSILSNENILSGGHPRELRNEDVVYLPLEFGNVAIIPINLTFGLTADSDLKNVLNEARKQSMYQIVVIHWGEEYKIKSNTLQQEFAHRLVDLGVDAVIGHHPHVVQEIEIYQNIPIFYSLGNFIFDQYKDDNVQEGLLIRMSVSVTDIIFELFPITSKDLKSAPKLMEGEERKVFLEKLAERSAEALRGQIESAIMTMPRY